MGASSSGENSRADALASDAARRSQSDDSTVVGWWESDAATRVGALAAPSIASTGRVPQAAKGHVRGDSGADDFAVQQIRTIGHHLPDPAQPDDHEDRVYPGLPAALDPTGRNDWSAIDHINVLDCFISPFRLLDDVPSAFREAWALANTDVHELY